MTNLQDGGFHKWRYPRENPMKKDDLGVPPFMETPICLQKCGFSPVKILQGHPGNDGKMLSIHLAGSQALLKSLKDG